jgi:hypothetical protein
MGSLIGSLFSDVDSEVAEFDGDVGRSMPSSSLRLRSPDNTVLGFSGSEFFSRERPGVLQQLVTCIWITEKEAAKL